MTTPFDASPDRLTPDFLPKVRPADLPDLVVAMARSGLALMLYGAPGTGKTSLLQGLAEDPALLAWASARAGRALDSMPVVTLSAPELNVEDLLGVPTVEELVRRDGGGRRKVTRWAVPELLDPDRPFVLFIDEPNRCEPSVRNALFQLITGRTTSAGFALPPGSVVVMAGNRLEDRAGVRGLDTAFSNRCGHFELEVDPEAWLLWAARQPGFASLVRAFIARHPTYLCRFDPRSASPQQATPRTWAGLGFALEGAPTELAPALIRGLLGVEAAQLFKAFQVHVGVVPAVEDLTRDPEGIPVPKEGELDRAWIFATAMADHLIAPGNPGAKEDPLGRSVGVALGRLAAHGFEEVTIYALRRAWRGQAGTRGHKGPALPSPRFLAALETIAGQPAFQHFLHAVQTEGLVA